MKGAGWLRPWFSVEYATGQVRPTLFVQACAGLMIPYSSRNRSCADHRCIQAGLAEWLRIEAEQTPAVVPHHVTADLLAMFGVVS
jgi:hypothetical protein